MTYVITEACTKDAKCVDVCPVDCIHPKKDESDFDSFAQLFVNPEDCIDCGACTPECEADAIFAEDEVPAEYRYAIAQNRDHFNN